MPSNLEVKAKIQSAERSITVAQSLGASFDGELNQVDTYFLVTHGRLKLREINKRQSELIFYDRNEGQAHRRSDFEIYPCPHPERLKDLLARSIGIKAIVEKQRKVYFFETTRIHIDVVKNLGSFLEFEVPIEGSDSAANEKMEYLVRKFEIAPDAYFRHSYVDLMLARNNANQAGI